MGRPNASAREGSPGLEVSRVLLHGVRGQARARTEHILTLLQMDDEGARALNREASQLLAASLLRQPERELSQVAVGGNDVRGRVVLGPVVRPVFVDGFQD